VVRAVRRALAGSPNEAKPNPWASRFAQGARGDSGTVSTEGARSDAERGETYNPDAQPAARLWDSAPAAEGAAHFGALGSAPPIVLGQFRDTYIVAAIDGDLWLFDQHTSHERARFEAIERRKAGERAQSQALLEPTVVEVSPSLALLAEEASLELYALGFELESFGAGSLLVRSIPHLLTGREPAEAVTKILRQIEEGSDTHWAVEGRTHRLAASLACHSAVRAGQKINPATMQEIVTGLLACEFQDYCPHGRPTRHRIPKEDVARWFERTGWRRS
jgi:DNA mismatch repair protein MutL